MYAYALQAQYCFPIVFIANLYFTLNHTVVNRAKDTIWCCYVYKGVTLTVMSWEVLNIRGIPLDTHRDAILFNTVVLYTFIFIICLFLSTGYKWRVYIVMIYNKASTPQVGLCSLTTKQKK